MMRLLTTPLLAAAVALGSSADANAFSLTIDPDRSTIEIAAGSADDGFGPYTGQEAAAGGFATSLSGMLEVNVTASTLQLLAGSTLVANDEGMFDPGDAPASFATTYPGVTILGGADFSTATRGLEFAIEDATPRSLTGTQISAGAPAVALIEGVADLSAGNPPTAPIGLLGLSGVNVATGPGTYELAGNVATLTLPFEFTIDIDGLIATSTTYAGSIVATGVVPEPGTLVLAGAALALVGCPQRTRG